VLSAAYSGLNIKVVGTRPGVTSEQNGGTISASKTPVSCGIFRLYRGGRNRQDRPDQAFPQILNLPAPVYLRFCASDTRKIYDADAEIILGKANVVKIGKDATIIANDNVMVDYALDAAEQLARKGFQIEVLDMHTIKPLDEEAVLRAAAKGPVLTAENHSIINGLGSAVAEVLAEHGCGIRFARFGIRDEFGVVGWKQDISEALGITVIDMVSAMERLLS
jgi:transketolase